MNAIRTFRNQIKKSCFYSTTNGQDQDFTVQDQDNFFMPQGASRPRPKSQGLHHCGKITKNIVLAL
jgi:hypothetical protein